MIREEGNNYSVPEQYAGKRVTVKKYPHTIEIFYGGRRIAVHERIHDTGKDSMNLYHYLSTLLRKPGALKNSVALKQVSELKILFEEHYNLNPKDFII